MRNQTPDRGLVRICDLYRAFLLNVHALDGTNFLQSIDAGFRCFLTFVHEMVEEELLMLFARMEVVWGQTDREHRHFSFQLDLHQGADHGLGHEVVTIDAAVYDQCRTDDAGKNARCNTRRIKKGPFQGLFCCRLS